MPSTTRYSPEPGDLLPPIVTICGSTRFWRHIAEAALQETVAGRMVLAPAVDMRRHHELWDDPAEAEQLKARLDALHLAKISTADEVLVVTDDQLYLGESTRREILFAEALEVPVSYWVAGRGRIGTSHLQHPTAARERAHSQWKSAFARLTEASPTGPAREDLLALAAADLAIAEHGTAASLVDVRRAARQHLGIDVPHDRAHTALTTRTEHSPGAGVRFLLDPADLLGGDDDVLAEDGSPCPDQPHPGDCLGGCGGDGVLMATMTWDDQGEGIYVPVHQEPVDCPGDRDFEPHPENCAACSGTGYTFEGGYRHRCFGGLPPAPYPLPDPDDDPWASAPVYDVGDTRPF